MPVHSLLVATAAGNILFAKYFDFRIREDNNGRLLFEQALLKETFFYWESLVSSNNPRSVVIFDCIYVVFKRLGDVLVFACGTDEIDETVLFDVLTTVGNILLDIVDGKIVESSFLLPESYGKFLVAIDEMMPQGIIESFDAQLIGKLSKLKNIS